jgi:cytochrome c oxidase assembly protein subunit 15
LAWSQAKRGIDPLGRTDKDLSSPTKQFRLANHLVLSYSQYILFVWAGLSALLRQTNISSIQHLGTLRTMAAGSKAAVIGTVLMGGMMAATDAGLVHNDWPSYSGHFIPQDFFEKSPFYRNFYESLGTIQMAHRHLAYIAASAVTGTWLYARRLALPSRVRMALNVMLAVVWMQAVLGVTTLRNHCDTSIASLHQLGSVSLVTAAVWFMHELRRIPK